MLVQLDLYYCRRWTETRRGSQSAMKCEVCGSESRLDWAYQWTSWIEQLRTGVFFQLPVSWTMCANSVLATILLDLSVAPCLWFGRSSWAGYCIWKWRGFVCGRWDVFLVPFEVQSLRPDNAFEVQSLSPDNGPVQGGTPVYIEGRRILQCRCPSPL